ncbi:hypothetical protein D9M68_653840 [compost metagenome]
MAAGIGRDAVDVVLEQHGAIAQADVGGALEGPGPGEVRVLVELVGHQPALVGLFGHLPEGVFLAGQQHVAEAQRLFQLAVVVDEAAPRHAVGAAGEEVAGQLDQHQLVMLLQHLGLQVAAPAGLGTAEEVLLVGFQGGRQRRAGGVLGHLQQAVPDQLVELRLAFEIDGVDVHQRAALTLAAGLQVFPGLALRFQLVACAGQHLAGAEQGAEAGDGEESGKVHRLHLQGRIPGKCRLRLPSRP